MAYDYENLYRTTPDALGAADPTLIALLSDHLAPPAEVLDIGCGQGRDALVLARLGYRVTGVDLAPSGIAALRAAAAREGLAITGEVADITAYRPVTRVDALFIDRTLHMLDARARHDTLAALLGAVLPGGWCLIADEPANMAGLREVLALAEAPWELVIAARSRLLARRGADQSKSGRPTRIAAPITP